MAEERGRARALSSGGHGGSGKERKWERVLVEGKASGGEEMKLAFRPGEDGAAWGRRSAARARRPYAVAHAAAAGRDTVSR